MKKTTPKQFETLVNFMMQNESLAKGYHKNTERAQIKEKWNDLKRKLNTIGPPSREAEGWMKVWADLKTGVKKKLVFNKAESQATGGGTFKQKVLTPLEESVAGLLQMNSIINPGPGIGIQSASISLDEEIHGGDINSDASEVEIVLPSQTNATSNRKRSRNTKAIEKQSLLEEQVKVQTELYNKVKKSLSEIERYSRKTYKLQEEQLRIKKQNLLIKKEEIKKKELYRLEILKLRKEEIHLKRRKIELEETRNGFSLE